MISNKAIHIRLPPLPKRISAWPAPQFWVIEPETVVEEPEAAVEPEAVVEAEPETVAETADVVEPEPAPLEDTVTESPDVVVAPAAPATASKSGLTSDGKASNDPRVAARKVEAVEITTAHIPMFTDKVAAPVEAVQKSAPRSPNDPRNRNSVDATESAAQGNT